MSNALKLRFHVAKRLGPMVIRAGSVVDVPKFWARICLEEGSASLAEARETGQAEADRLESESESGSKPKRSQRVGGKKVRG